MWTCFLDATQTPLRSNQLTQTCYSFPSSQPFSEEKFVRWTTRLAQKCIYAVADWVYFHMWKQLYAILWTSNDWLYMKLFLHVKIKRTDFDKQALRNLPRSYTPSPEPHFPPQMPEQTRFQIFRNYLFSAVNSNPGDSRFWTVSPGLQIRVWYLPDNHQNCYFLYTPLSDHKLSNILRCLSHCGNVNVSG